MFVRTKDEHGFPGKNKKILLFLINDLKGLPGFKFKPSTNKPVPPITIVISDLLLLSSLSKIF